MKTLRNIVIGITLGLSTVFPGASVGTTLLIFGIYEYFINNLNESVEIARNTLKKLLGSKNLKGKVNAIFEGILELINEQKSFLIPIGIICILSMLFFSKLFASLKGDAEIVRNYIFVGLIVASIPILVYDVIVAHNQKLKEELEKTKEQDVKKVKKQYIFTLFKNMVPGIITFLFLTILFILKQKGIGLNIVKPEELGITTIIPAIIVGAIGSIAMLFPGISGALVIGVLGYYDVMLFSINKLQLIFLIPLGIGVILGLILAIKAIKFLLEKYTEETNFAVIGFVIGSVLLMLPKSPNNGYTTNLIVNCVIAFIGGVILAFLIKYVGGYFKKFEENNK